MCHLAPIITDPRSEPCLRPNQWYQLREELEGIAMSIGTWILSLNDTAPTVR